jgi:uncharacterized membrane protein
MTQTHIHLLITHLPIFGSILGGLVLAHGIWTKSNQTKIASYNLFILSAIGAGIAYFTGEAAEESVENIQGIAKSTIEEHEEFALISLVALIILGVISLIALFITLRKSPHTRSLAMFALLVSLVCFGLIARTGYLGGLIRHTELNASSTSTLQQGEAEEEED